MGSFFCAFRPIWIIGQGWHPTGRGIRIGIISITSRYNKEKKVSKIGDTIHSKNFDITILNKDVSDTVTDKSGYFQSTANGTFIILTVQYKNTANRAMRLDNSAFKLKLEDKTYSPVTIIMTSKDNIFLDTINPGIEKTGKLYFDVPKDIAH